MARLCTSGLADAIEELLQDLVDYSVVVVDLVQIQVRYDGHQETADVEPQVPQPSGTKDIETVSTRTAAISGSSRTIFKLYHTEPQGVHKQLLNSLVLTVMLVTQKICWLFKISHFNAMQGYSNPAVFPLLVTQTPIFQLRWL